jgi:predicted dehydrogenase
MQLTRLAMIGTRGHFRLALNALPSLPDVRVVGISNGGADSLDPLTTWCQQNGHSPQVFDDYRDLLEQARPDAVVVCGPFEHHAAISIDAIQRGIHVFVEKPAALSFDQLDQLKAAHAEHPEVHLAQMMASRYSPGFYTARQLIQDNAIGDVRLLNARKSYKLGNRPDYYRDRDTYGGTIPWVGIHAIDWILWLSGRDFESVSAVHSTGANNGLGTMERSALCQYTLTGDRFASVSMDIFRPPTAPTHGDDWIRIVGTEGVLEARPDSLSLINQDNNGTSPVPLQQTTSIFEDFVAHIEGRRKALIDADATFATTEAALAAREAADTRTVFARRRS